MLQRWGGASHRDPVPVIGPQASNRWSKASMTPTLWTRKVSRRASWRSHAAAVGRGRSRARVHAGRRLGCKSGGARRKDGLTITAFAVNHYPVFPAAGYRFDYRGRSVVISGDTAPSQTLAKYSRGVDVLFHEGLQTAMVSVLHDDAIGNGRPALAKITADIPSYHTTPEDAARIAQQSGVRYLMFYHTIPPLPLAYLNAAFLGDAPKIFKGPITVGKDGMMMSLPAGATAVTMRELL